MHTHTVCARFARLARDEPSLARSRSLALRSSPRLCSACLARCTLATSPAARSHPLPCLPARVARRLACAALASLMLRLLPRACPLLCARHAFCSLRSPARLLLAALALPAARSSLLRLLRSPPRQLLISLRSPPRLRLLASFARRLTYSPASLALSASPSSFSVSRLLPGNAQ